MPRGHRLAAIAGTDNAVLLESRATGQIMLVGPGAGGDETASAVLADILSVLGTHQGSFLHNALADAGRPIAPPGSVPSRLLHAHVGGRPAGRAGAGRARSSPTRSSRSSRCVQSGSGDEASLVLILHAGPEDRMQRAVARIRGARRRAAASR